MVAEEKTTLVMTEREQAGNRKKRKYQRRMRFKEKTES